jgi:DNA replication protein DnaC
MLLTELRLPTIKRLWPALAEQSNREGWTAERFLSALCEHELNERETRRIERHKLESCLPPDKRLSDFDFAAVPTVPSRTNALPFARESCRRRSTRSTTQMFATFELAKAR